MKNTGTLSGLRSLENKSMTGDKVLDVLINNRKPILLILALLFITTFFYFLYRYRNTRINQAAYSAMTSLLDAEKKLLSEEDGFEQFQHLEQEAEASSRGSGLYPFIIMEKANVLLSKDEYAKATEVMQQALKNMPDGFLKDLYRVKKCLVFAAMDDEAVVETSLVELEGIAMKADTDSVVKKMALYFLHKVYWQRKNFDQAIAFGKKFLALEQSSTEESYSFSRLGEVVLEHLDLVYID